MQLYYTSANEPQNILLNGVSVRLTESGVTQDDVTAVSAILGISTDQAARMLRKAALVDSDWTQLPDTQLDKAAWATYRQAMRDITDQPGFPDAIIWPEKPEEV